MLLFTQFDSDTAAPARFCFHTAFNDPTVDPTLPQRESVEVRAIAFFGAPARPTFDKTLRDEGRRVLSRLGLGEAPRRYEDVHSGDVGELLKQLAQGAANGLIEASELPELLDLAAYNGAQNEDFLKQLCTDRRIDYRPHHWQPGGEGEAVLEELRALKTFERTAFLAPPKRVERGVDVDGAEAREDLAALRRMFPRTAPDAIQAVYVGFAGNFETTVEMLSLALAEEREH